MSPLSWGAFSHCCPPGRSFTYDFVSYSERSPTRIVYILFELENALRRRRNGSLLPFGALDAFSKFQAIHLRPKSVGDTAPEWLNSIGNWILIEPELLVPLQQAPDMKERKRLILESKLVLTSEAAQWLSCDPYDVRARAEDLASIATDAWPLPTGQ